MKLRALSYSLSFLTVPYIYGQDVENVPSTENSPARSPRGQVIDPTEDDLLPTNDSSLNEEVISEEEILDEEIETSEENILLDFQPRKAGKKQKKTSPPENFCQINPGNNLNGYIKQPDCNDPTTSGQPNHTCTIKCSHKNERLYHTNEDGTQYVAVGEDINMMTLSCQKDKKSGSLKWNVDYNFESLQCLLKKNANKRPPALAELLSIAEPESASRTSPPVSPTQPKQTEISFESDFNIDFQNLDIDFSIFGENFIPRPELRSNDGFDLSRGNNNNQDYEAVPKGTDISHITCPMNKKEPSKGRLNCETTVTVKGKSTAQAGDTCSVHCDRGYKSTSYTKVSCLAVRNKRTGDILGAWSQKKSAECVHKSEFGPITPTEIEDDWTRPTLPPTTVPVTTRKPKVNRVEAYFPDDWPENNKLPAGYQNLNTKRKTDKNTQNNIMNNLSELNKWTGRNKILPDSKCTVCTNAKTMKECLNQKQTCNLRKGEICSTQVETLGNEGGVIINRGCENRSVCLGKYFDGIRYKAGEDDDLLSGLDRRPEQQCRYVGQQLSRGNTMMGEKFVKKGKVCQSCHREALSVPYF